MRTEDERRAAHEAGRKEATRLAEATAEALRRHSIAMVPRPGFAARRQDRMQRVPSTRREG